MKLRLQSFLISLISMALLLLSCGNDSELNSTQARESDMASTSAIEAVIQSREDALSTLASMGMVVLDEPLDAPDFSLPLLSGGETSLSDYRGKVVFLNFWATWCGPCRIEMPSMQTLYSDLQDEAFVVLAINQLEDTDIVQEFIDETEFTFPVVMDDGRVSAAYGVRGIPTTYILNPQGQVIAGKVGTHIYDGSIYRDLFRELMN